MDADDIEKVAALFVAARRSGTPLQALPEPLRPTTLEDAHAIQAAAAVQLGEQVAGWKVAFTPERRLARGGLLASRVARSGDTLSSAMTPVLGIEAEIAFRFDRALPPRAAEYEYEEVAAAVTAVPGIEIVDSRYADYPKPPLLDRVADFHSNGAYVLGTPLADWRSRDLVNLDVEVVIDGQSVVRRVGGHAAKDPLLPAVALVNDLRTSTGIEAGRFVTTGSYTGINYAKPGQSVQAIFHGLAEVSLQFDRSKET